MAHSQDKRVVYSTQIPPISKSNLVRKGAPNQPNLFKLAPNATVEVYGTLGLIGIWEFRVVCFVGRRMEVSFKDS